MKLIVGLGNVGDKYARTRHNLGFMVIDRLVAGAELPACIDNAKFEAAIVEGQLGGQKVLLAKPHTMMNLSGRSVGKLASFYKLEPADVWVIHDELDLPFGRLRVRVGGGAAGHNGLRSIVDAIGEGFGRFRIGIANERLRNPVPADAYVLARFDEAEEPVLPSVVDKTAEVVLDNLANGNLEDTTYELLS